MEWIPYIVAYLGMAVFGVAVIARFFMWARMPMHMRWELYPVAHEGKRARYGGSYLEESEWWTKPRHTSLWGEVRAMALEIVFLVALKEHNFKLWLRSFPFHFGLYLVIGATAVMAGAGVLTAIWPACLATWFGTLLHYAILVMGVAGLVLGLAGALGLLHRRLTAPDLKDFTTKSDIFNLLFFIAAFGVALLTFAVVDRDFSRISFFWYSLVTFKFAQLPGSTLETVLPAASVILLSLLVAYVPLTHMSHFVGKYFAYHAIRWNDTPNLRGGKQEKTIQDLLSLPVSWSAAHIKADGRKSWAEVCTDVAVEEPKK